MTVEVVTRDDGTPGYVIDGNPNKGYFVHRIGKPIARFDHSDQAWDAIADGEFEERP